MADHGGQMPGGKLDVTELWVTEPEGEDAPAEAIPQGGEFTLHVKFSGSGSQWKNMKKEGHNFEIYFHLEGIGRSEEEMDYGPKNVTLNKNTDCYEVMQVVTAQENTLPVGLYRCGCTVEDTNWVGAVGFFDGLVIQIYKNE